MATARRSDHVRSPFIAGRRRKLFPAEDQDVDSELGHISPIHSDDERTSSETMSPLKLSPCTRHTSPSHTLKTPHDTSTKPCLLEKEQKALLEESKSLKRKASSPEHHNKSSKVRTALFPPVDMALPAKSFYAKSLQEGKPKAKHNYKPMKLITTKHGHRPGRKLGQINNGVRHKIRKPKHKKSVGNVAKTSKKMLYSGGSCSSALNEYICDLTEMKKKQNVPQRLIEPPKAPEENKENSTSPNRKFLKASRHKEEDFLEDDTEHQLNIEGIISSLSSQSPEKPSRVCSVESDGQIVGDIALEYLRYTTPQVIFPDSIAQDNNVTSAILSPISQMCDVTSGLALDSPSRNDSRLTKGSTVSKILSFNSTDNMEEQQKLFPVFYKVQSPRGEKRERADVLKRSVKRFKALAPDQMLLDAGQKKFGFTLCNECNLVYHMGDPNDEIRHSSYHNFQHVLRFAGWKNEHLIADFNTNGRIIRVFPNDSKIWLKKIKNLMKVVTRDLGSYEMEYDLSQAQVYLFIKNRTIAGCAAATVPKERGHRMLSTLSAVAMCSEESYPIKCGISYIWVAANYRKQGIASALMDAVKNNFSFGQILSNDDIALTSPTEAGSAFAEKYFKTPNYLIYFV